MKLEILEREGCGVVVVDGEDVLGVGHGLAYCYSDTEQNVFPMLYPHVHVTQCCNCINAFLQYSCLVSTLYTTQYGITTELPLLVRAECSSLTPDGHCRNNDY